MKKIRRIVALISVAIIVLLVIATLICAVTGSKYFFGMLALSFLVPITLWVFMWFSNMTNKEKEDSQSELEETK